MAPFRPEQTGRKRAGLHAELLDAFVLGESTSPSPDGEDEEDNHVLSTPGFEIDTLEARPPVISRGASRRSDDIPDPYHLFRVFSRLACWIQRQERATRDHGQEIKITVEAVLASNGRLYQNPGRDRNPLYRAQLIEFIHMVINRGQRQLRHEVESIGDAE